MERNILNRGSRYLLGPAEIRFRLIDDHREVFLVRVMCAMLAASTTPIAAANMLLGNIGGGSKPRACSAP
jgi:hypothetical protein